MKRFIISLATIIMAGVLVVACSAAASKPTANTTPLGESPIVTANVAPPVVTAPPSTETVSQRAAVRKAQSYIDGQAFSKAGLIRQLTSQFEGYAKADAEYAVNHITVDWMVEAEQKAASYMELQGFSRSGLIQQMTSKVEGFTKAEAEHGAKSVGL